MSCIIARRKFGLAFLLGSNPNAEPNCSFSKICRLRQVLIKIRKTKSVFLAAFMKSALKIYGRAAKRLEQIRPIKGTVVNAVSSFNVTLNTSTIKFFNQKNSLHARG